MTTTDSRSQDAYVMLISSLPKLGAPFLAKRPPLSRFKLDQRLRALDDKDKETLYLVEEALNWRRLPIAASEMAVIQRASTAISEIDHTGIREIIRERMEMRTCIAALRRRAQGQGPPKAPWGFGRWVRHIERNWADPDFRLLNTFTWLRDANNMLKRGDTQQLERLILEQSYRLTRRHSAGHIFDFQAVVIYVLTWNILDRATHQNTELASRRFEKLAVAGLGVHTRLFKETPDGP